MATADESCIADGDPNVSIDIHSISNADLRRRLLEAGIPCGGITPGTRDLYEEKLLKSQGILNELHETPLQPECSNSSDISIDLEEHDAGVFYGLFVPRESDEAPGVRLIYTRRQEIVEAARKIKGARFKAFSSREEAERYANSETGNDAQSDRDTSPVFEGNENHLSAPKTQELTGLRRSIERAELESFNKSVQSNPRCLVSSGDTPVALQISCKWNALHIAAKSNQVAIAESLMDALKDDEFWKKLYPSDAEETREKRKAFVIDLYLNSPDVGVS